MYKFLIFPIFLLLFSSSCKDPAKEFNNKNANPEVLVLNIDGKVIKDAVERNFGDGCTIAIPFGMRVKTEVRTATWSNSTVTIDPDPYIGSENDLFFGVDGKKPAEIILKVPKEGAYQLRIEVELDDVCSRCCQGSKPNQCGGTVNACGKPKVIFEKNYMSNTRPPFEQTLIFVREDWKVRQCYNCGCFGCK